MQSCDLSAAVRLPCLRILLSMLMGLSNGCVGCWAGIVLLISLCVPSFMPSWTWGANIANFARSRLRWGSFTWWRLVVHYVTTSGGTCVKTSKVPARIRFRQRVNRRGPRRRCKWLEILLLTTMVQNLVCYSCGNWLSLSVPMHLYARAGLVCARMTLLNLVACSHHRRCVNSKRTPRGSQCGANAKGILTSRFHPSRALERKCEPEFVRAFYSDGVSCLSCHTLRFDVRTIQARTIHSFIARTLARGAQTRDMQARAWARGDRGHGPSAAKCPDHVCVPTYYRVCNSNRANTIPVTNLFCVHFHARHIWGASPSPEHVILDLGTRRVGEAQNPGPESLVTLATINVTRLDKYKDEIVPLNYDLLALTETSAHASELRRLPKFFAKEGFQMISSRPCARRVRSGQHQGPRWGGTAILSRLPMRSAEHVLHEDLLMTTRVCAGFVRLGSIDVQILSVYLVPPCSNRAALNDMIMDHVWACVASWYGPTIVLGDLNQAPENLPAWKLMEARGWHSVSTISQNKLGKTLAPTFTGNTVGTSPDTILVDPRLVHAVKDCGVQCDSPFPGHRPIWIQLEVESPSQSVSCAT